MEERVQIDRKYNLQERIQYYILYRLYHKSYRIGSKLFYSDIESSVGGNKTAYAKARIFLEGAGLLVDEVIISDKVPNYLVERYGLAHAKQSSDH